MPAISSRSCTNKQTCVCVCTFFRSRELFQCLNQSMVPPEEEEEEEVVVKEEEEVVVEEEEEVVLEEEEEVVVEEEEEGEERNKLVFL